MERHLAFSAEERTLAVVQREAPEIPTVYLTAHQGFMDMKHMIALGVDGIVSDYPGQLRKRAGAAPPRDPETPGAGFDICHFSLAPAT